jgi:hypothetical protein
MKKMKLPHIDLTKKKGAQKKGGETAGKQGNKPVSFSQQLFGAFIILMFLTWGYSIITEKKATPTVPLSEFAILVNAHDIVSITVEGDSLTGTKADATKVTSKKESGASVFFDTCGVRS